MGLNCKVGDLAILVSGSENAGRIVRVLRAARVGDIVFSLCGVKMHVHREKMWHIEGTTSRRLDDGRIVESPVSDDCDLRPIRDPGDDETCNSSAWLPPVPQLQKEVV